MMQVSTTTKWAPRLAARFEQTAQRTSHSFGGGADRQLVVGAARVWRRGYSSPAPGLAAFFPASARTRNSAVLSAVRSGSSKSSSGERADSKWSSRRFLTMNQGSATVDFTTVLDEYEIPTQERIMTKNQRRRFSEFSNETLAVMASQGVHGAFKERLLREIMRIDKCSYKDAYVVLSKMNTTLEEYVWLFRLPYQSSIIATWIVGIILVPMGVFHYDTAVWFNDAWVHCERPPMEDLDTLWKVGTWTWTWMEPFIGTASFVLLAMQLVRSNMMMIDLKPFAAHVLTWRANRLHLQFPVYEREIIRDYAKSDPWGRDTYRVRLGFPANSVIPLHGHNKFN